MAVPVLFDFISKPSLSRCIERMAKEYRASGGDISRKKKADEGRPGCLHSCAGNAEAAPWISEVAKDREGLWENWEAGAMPALSPQR